MARTNVAVVLVLAGLLSVPASAEAQGADIFGAPWTNASVELLDESDVGHMSESRTVDFEMIGESSRKLCREMKRQAMMTGDAHERVLRSSDLIMAHLQASTFNRFGLEELTASHRTRMVERFGAMTYGESMMMHTGLALQHGTMPPAGAPSFPSERDQQSLPYDCQ